IRCGILEPVSTIAHNGVVLAIGLIVKRPSIEIVVNTIGGSGSRFSGRVCEGDWIPGMSFAIALKGLNCSLHSDPVRELLRGDVTRSNGEPPGGGADTEKCCP